MTVQPVQSADQKINGTNGSTRGGRGDRMGGIKSDNWIIKMCAKDLGEASMITPFSARQMRKSVISYGVGSYGYDFRLGPDVKIISNAYNDIIDPKDFKRKLLVQAEIHQDKDGSRFVVIPPHGFALGHTVEHWNIPRSILVVCLGKSTYARVGLIVNVTPFEPMWKGFATLELSNTTPLPVKVYINEGIGQAIFLQSMEGDECKVSYADRNGKYQDQKAAVTLPKV